MLQRRYQVAWIDDETASLVRPVDRLSDHGWSVALLHPMDKDIKMRVDSSDAVILDLRWRKVRVPVTDAPFATAKRIAQYVTTVAPNKPLLFVSNWFADRQFANIEREVNPAAITARVDKHGGASADNDLTSASREDIEEVMVNEIDNTLRGMLDRSSQSDSPLASAVESLENMDEDSLRGVFDISLPKYTEMDVDERLDITRKAGELADEFVDSVFENSQADWILIGGMPPKVVFWGTYRDRITDKEIDSIASNTGAVPFLFSRPELMR